MQEIAHSFSFIRVLHACVLLVSLNGSEWQIWSEFMGNENRQDHRFDSVIG